MRLRVKSLRRGASILTLMVKLLAVAPPRRIETFREFISVESTCRGRRFRHRTNFRDSIRGDFGTYDWQSAQFNDRCWCPMRADLHKVLTEQPRHCSGSWNLKTHISFRDYDESRENRYSLPKGKAVMQLRELEPWNEDKDFTDKLGR
jgi:hypothetical protein